ncbi:hypothetical protein F11_05970 [Rhodospirillum rubrum F11]|nr:hypothetical protein F11_05970 [Rhodospirillum rubrum F11]MBK5953524.1 hypothetical protein [Rhodospirillum rubrum]HAQ00719.1 hypothetical protein [Rhodospirillum rubrum]HCF16974.1 hypothetical protein [Rhodospirillum rubrum]
MLFRDGWTGSGKERVCPGLFLKPQSQSNLMNLMTPAAAETIAAPICAPEEEAGCILKAAERILTDLERIVSRRVV